MTNKDRLLKILNDKYSKLIFKFKEDPVFEYYLVYKTFNIEDAKEFKTLQFVDELDSICEKYLSEQELEELVIVYDHLDYIKNDAITISSFFNKDIKITLDLKYTEELQKKYFKIKDINITNLEPNYKKSKDVTNFLKNTKREKFNNINKEVINNEAFLNIKNAS